MEYGKMIADMRVNDSVEGFYVLKTAQSKTSTSGKPFLNALLSDRSGTLDAKVWDYGGPVGAADEGKVVKVRGTVTEFRGTRQMVIDRIRLAEDTDPVRLEELVPAAPIDMDAAWAEIQGLVETMEDADYAAVCREMLDIYGNALRQIPAGKSVHHSFVGGLLMHTVNMLRTADFLAGLYADTVNRSLLLAGTVLHDIAKAQEFTFSHLGLVTDYSVKGQLLGHLVMGAQEAERIAWDLEVPEEKSVLLQHMILSHHGEPEYGAAVRPQCAESELLSLIDMIDSRMEIYRETFAEVEPGSFSGRIFALEKRIYRHQ